MTYSLDFRKKVLAVKEQENLSLINVAARFSIGVATVFRWTQDIEVRRSRVNKKPSKLCFEILSADVEKYPDSYHAERAARLGASEGKVCLAMKRHNLTRKKNTKSS